MLYYLATNKSIQDRLRKEVNDNVDDNGRIDLDVLSDLEYMDQAFHGIGNKFVLLTAEKNNFIVCYLRNIAHEPTRRNDLESMHRCN